MGRTSSRGWGGALVAAATAAAVLAGCGSVGSWVPGSEDAVDGAQGSRPTQGESWSPAVEATGTPTVTAAPVPSSTPSAPTPTSTPTAAPERPAPKPTPTKKPRTNLVRGDSGPEVRALQVRLTELGYWLGRPDGSFGALTQQAVYAIQKAAGLRRDGVVGPRTTRALEAGVRPRTSLAGDGVEIVLSRQLLLVVRGGEVRTILNTSTGNGEVYTSTSGNRSVASTPRGSFAVYRGVDGPVTNSLGELWRPRFFHRGIAVHGSPNIPPWPASHGCARLSNAAINMIWAKDLMPLGSRVVVR
ncbi:MAG TPA: peptidoglycan-binding protein [Ornithinibacter sp.]|nr:peptidoglycan-binding protein [Ornithinibacter sp.]